MSFSSSSHRPECSSSPAGHASAAAHCSGVFTVWRLTTVQKPAVRPQEERGGDTTALLIYSDLFVVVCRQYPRQLLLCFCGCLHFLDILCVMNNELRLSGNTHRCSFKVDCVHLCSVKQSTQTTDQLTKERKISSSQIFSYYLCVLTAFETNQSNGPEGSDHSHSLQADPATCNSSPPQSSDIIRGLQDAALRRSGR